MAIKILHGDDEAPNLALLEYLAASWDDCELTQVGQLGDMIQMIADERFDVIITDSFDKGYPACVSRFREKNPKGLVILLSAYNANVLNLKEVDLFIQKAVSYKTAEELETITLAQITKWKRLNQSGENFSA